MSVWYAGGPELLLASPYAGSGTGDLNQATDIEARLSALEARMDSLAGLAATESWCLSMFPLVSRPPSAESWYLSNNGLETRFATAAVIPVFDQSSSDAWKVAFNVGSTHVECGRYDERTARLDEYLNMSGNPSVGISSKVMAAKRIPVDYCIPRVTSPAGNHIAITCADTPWGIVQGNLQTEAGVLALGAGTSNAYIRSNDTTIVRFQGLTGSTVSLGTNLQTYQFNLASSGSLTQAQADARYLQQADTTLVKCTSDDGGKLIMQALGLNWHVPTMPYMEAAYRTYAQNDNVYLSKYEASVTYAPQSSIVDTSQFVTTANLSSTYLTKQLAAAMYVPGVDFNNTMRRYVRSRYWDTLLDPNTSSGGGNTSWSINFHNTPAGNFTWYSNTPVGNANNPGDNRTYAQVAGYNPPQTWGPDSLV